MSTIPHYSSSSSSPSRVLMDRSIDPQEDVITLDSSNADAGGSETYRFRAGNVVVLRTSTGRYVEADDTNADAPTAASVRSDITNPGSGGWDGDLVITGHWGTITVALSGDDDDAAVAAKIIAGVAAQNPETQARITAADESGDSELSITNFDTGAGTWLHAEHATVATMMGAGGASSRGTDPDVRVTLNEADLQNKFGTAVHADVLTARRGNFDESNLVVGGSAASTTASLDYAEAKSVLVHRGSEFN